MSQFKPAPRVGLFEKASIVCMALVMIWFAGVLAYAALRYRGVL